LHHDTHAGITGLTLFIQQTVYLAAGTTYNIMTKNGRHSTTQNTKKQNSLNYSQWLDSLLQGSHTSWLVQESLGFFPGFSKSWKVLKNQFSPGKSWKLKLKVLECTGK